MKSACIILAALLLAPCMAEEEGPVADLPETLVLTDGRAFEKWSVMRETESRVTVRHAKGATIIEKRLLPPGVLAKYPITGVESPPAGSQTTVDVEPPSGRVSFSNIAVRATDASETYVRYAWNVTVHNRISTPRKVTPRLKFLDKEKFLLDDAMGETAVVYPGESKVISSKSLIRTELWDATDIYQVEEFR